MIIKGERVKTSRAMAPLIRHLLSGEENEAVTVVRGTEDDIRSAFADARALDRNFSIRHFIISPAVETSDEDAEMVLGLLGREFAFDPATALPPLQRLDHTGMRLSLNRMPRRAER